MTHFPRSERTGTRRLIAEYDVARHRIDDLHRRAEARRLGHLAVAPRGVMARLRTTVSTALITAGERLRPRDLLADPLACTPCDQMAIDR